MRDKTIENEYEDCIYEFECSLDEKTIKKLNKPTIISFNVDGKKIKGKIIDFQINEGVCEYTLERLKWWEFWKKSDIYK